VRVPPTLRRSTRSSFSKDHVAAYLEESTFRFSRRHSAKPGMLFYRLMTLAAVATPLHCQDIVQNATARAATSPSGKKSRSKRLVITEQGKSWRAVSPEASIGFLDGADTPTIGNG